jgi:C-terminal processing protease CtpA/Prc
MHSKPSLALTMPTKIIREPIHVEALANMLRGRKLPITVTWTQGAPRSTAQNRLAQRWFTDIAAQLGDQTHEDVRAECKLRFGVPILRAENDAFRLSYDRVIKALPYEQKLDAIKAFDLPVTRLMTVKQMTAFMDEMQRHWSAQGVRLTDPEALKYESEFQ